eukprot:GEMP01038187.1.p2 GENE.GEMP01038187.1~~GEMP01038187.1.p2  ORF type:complete len:145 (+),score=15.72 GEMP01038187.1:189-623(+)
MKRISRNKESRRVRLPIIEDELEEEDITEQGNPGVSGRDLRGEQSAGRRLLWAWPYAGRWNLETSRPGGHWRGGHMQRRWNFQNKMDYGEKNRRRLHSYCRLVIRSLHTPFQGKESGGREFYGIYILSRVDAGRGTREAECHAT